MDLLINMRGGRLLEVHKYGDPDGHPVVFFHGLIGSHHQAAYIDGPARREGLMIVAWNRPGVGRSGFVAGRGLLDATSDIEDLANSLGLGEFSVIGLSGGAAYALAALHGLRDRVRTATLVSGMGPMTMPGALRGMRRADRVGLEVGARFFRLARREFAGWSSRFRDDPRRFLRGFVAHLVPADRALFRRSDLAELFLKDLHAVFIEGVGPEGLARELALYRDFGFPIGGLPAGRRVVLWQGLDDDLVPPSMAWALARRLPDCEAHFVPGGHFVALEIADRVVARLRRLLDGSELA